MPQRWKYEVILYSLTNGNAKSVVIAATFDNLPMARLAAKQIASGKGWEVNRRPDVHTIGDLVCTIRTKGV